MPKHLRRGIGAFLGFLLGSAFVVPELLAPSAGASQWNSADPSIEICKTFVNATPALSVHLNAPGTFTISGDSTTYTVDAGFCSPQINESAGTHVITETGPATWYSTTAITQSEPAGTVLTKDSSVATAPGHYWLGTQGSAGADVVVSAVAGITDTVNFTNTLSPGYVEVCKAAATGSGATGTYTFSLTGNDGFGTAPNALVTATAQIGPGTQCSAPVEVPAGSVHVNEQGTNLDVTAIAATFNGSGNALTAYNLVAGTSTITVNPSDTTTAGVGNISIQTDETFTDGTVGLKICKAWTGPAQVAPITATTEYPFTVTPATGSAAGPVPAPYSFQLQAGQCENPVVNYRAGTSVTITEGAVPGSKVASITTDGFGESVATGSPSALNGTTTIVVGTPTTSTSTTTPADEAVVTFNNEDATPGQLKICKILGTPVPVTITGTATTTFTFTITGASTSPMTSGLQFTNPLVAGTQLCAQFPNVPFNSTVNISEAGSTGNAVSAITVNPGGSTFVTETGGATTEPVLVGTPSLTAGTVTVMTNEGGTTEVDYTDIDPPVVSGPVTTSPGPGGGTVTTSGGSSSGGGSSSVTPVVVPTTAAGTVTTGVSTVVISLPNQTPVVSSSSSPTVGLTSTVTSTTKPLTAAQKRALLKADEKSLAKLKSSIAHEEKLIKTAKGKALTADKKRLASLNASLKTLNKQIKLLK